MPNNDRRGNRAAKFYPAAARLGGPDINEILKRQNEELMKDIASRTAGPDINEFLKNQKTGRVLPDVESANDGPARGLPTDAEPDAEVDPDSDE